MTIRVSRQQLSDTAARWDDLASDAGTARRSLDSVETDGLDRVGVALAAVISTWSKRCDVLERRGERHADSLRTAVVGFTRADVLIADDMEFLLDYRPPR